MSTVWTSPTQLELSAQACHGSSLTPVIHRKICYLYFIMLHQDALSLSLFYTIEPSTQLPLVSPKLHRGSTRPNSNGRERHRWHTSGDFSLLCLSMLISICEGRKHISHTWRGHRHFPITKPAFAPHKHFTGTVSNRWWSWTREKRFVPNQEFELRVERSGQAEFKLL